MEASASQAPIAKKLQQILEAVYYMIKKGIISKRKQMPDLHLLKRTKIMGKAMANVLTFNNHHNGAAAFSCSFMDPNTSFYNPQEVEFSCSNTPSYPSFHLNKRKNRKNESAAAAAAAIARAFEMLSDIENCSDAESSVMPSPSPALMLSTLGSNCRTVKQLRVTDSPFPILREDEVADGRVDKEAEEFIKKFYQQLKIQQRIAMTPK